MQLTSVTQQYQHQMNESTARAIKQAAHNGDVRVKALERFTVDDLIRLRIYDLRVMPTHPSKSPPIDRLVERALVHWEAVFPFCPPTITELAALINRSRDKTHYAVQRLIDAGVCEKTGKGHRTLKLIKREVHDDR